MTCVNGQIPPTPIPRPVAPALKQSNKLKKIIAAFDELIQYVSIYAGVSALYRNKATSCRDVNDIMIAIAKKLGNLRADCIKAIEDEIQERWEKECEDKRQLEFDESKYHLNLDPDRLEKNLQTLAATMKAVNEAIKLWNDAVAKSIITITVLPSSESDHVGEEK